MSLDRLASFLADTLSAAAPLAVAALGGLLTEAAGSLSVALEGSMLVGAFADAAAAKASASFAVGVAASVGAGVSLSLLVGLAAGALRADVFVAGLAANLLAPGLISLLSGALYGTKGVLSSPALLTSSHLRDPLTRLPVVGPAIFGQETMVYLLAAAAALLWILHSRTVFGLRLRAAGEGNEAARAAGLEPGPYRLAAHILAGAAAGLAGAALASHVGAFVPGISAGRGWIALVAVYLGAKRPGGVVLSCLGFGFLIALSNAAQGFAAAPAELLGALPYLATAVALTLWKRAARAEGRSGSRASGEGT